MEHILRLFDFNVYNTSSIESFDEEEEQVFKDTAEFVIQMFGVDEKGKIYSVISEGYRPFFYLSLIHISEPTRPY